MNTTPLHRSLVTRAFATAFALTVVSAIALIVALQLARTVVVSADRMLILQQGNTHLAQVLALSYQQFGVAVAERDRVRQALTAEMQAMEDRFRTLRDGDAARGLPPAQDPVQLAQIGRREAAWRQSIRPVVERIQHQPALPAATADLELLTREVRGFLEDLERSVGEARTATVQRIEAREIAGYAIIVLLALVSMAAFFSVRRIAVRLGALTGIAGRIAAGAFELKAPEDGHDEAAELSRAFNSMTAQLEQTLAGERAGRARQGDLLRAVAETTNRLGAATAAILASTAGHASGAHEQLAAVSQTASALDQVSRSAEQSATRARNAAATAQRSEERGRTGHEAVARTIEAMGRAKAQADGVAASILGLAEQVTAVEDVTAIITDLAEQTNVLALNAAIEATRAGEQGAGFKVVATEVKALADQSKRSIAEVREVLADIQKTASKSVFATEESGRTMEAAMHSSREAGEVIAALAALAAELSRAASEVAASTGEQAIGVEQIQQAMRNINRVAGRYAESTKDAERAAADLNALNEKLRTLLATTAS